MAILKNSDLFDFEGYSASLKALEMDTQSWAQSTVTWLNRIKASERDATEQLNGIEAALRSLSTANPDKAVAQFKSYEQQIERLSYQLDGARHANDHLSDAQRLNGQVISGLTSKLDSLQKRYQALDPSQKDYLKQQRAILNEAKTVTKAIDAQSKSLKAGKTIIDAAENSVAHLKKSTAELKRTLDGLPNAYDAGTGKINEQNKAAVSLNAQYQKSVTLLKQIESGQQVHNRNVGNYPKPGGSGAISAIGDLTGLGGVATAAGVGALVASASSAVLEVGQEYEKLNALTENALNNNKKAAAEANAVIRDFADHSPHDMEGVTKAFNRMVDIGIVPTKEQLTELSDMAVAKNKTVMDYVEAIADAQQGEFERLKEFGINASKAGDKVNFTFKGVRTTVANNSQAISDYLIGLGKVPGVMGATDKLAQQFSGRWSTIKDGIKGAASDIYQFLLPALNGLLGFLGKGVSALSNFTAGLRQMAKEQGFLATALKFAVNPFAATTEAYQARDRAATVNPNQGTPELDKYRKQLQQQQKVAEAKRKAEDAAAKAAKDADKVLNENLSNRKAANDTELAQLEANKQDGLISEKLYIEERQRITLAGITERQQLLARAGKKETDDYKHLAADKLEAETLYKRDSLKLKLSDSKSDASKAVTGLARDKEDGSISEADFVEGKRGIMVASLSEQKQILAQAGQANSKLSKEIDAELLEVGRVYYKDRLKAQEEAWKKELEQTKVALTAYDQTLGEDYQKKLAALDKFYNEKERKVEVDMAGRTITPDEGEAQLYAIRLERLKAELELTESTYQQDRQLSNAVVDDKIAALKRYKEEAIRTPAEIAAAENAIVKLKQARDKEAADDKKRLDNAVADNAQKADDLATEHQKKNAKDLADHRQQLWQAGLQLADTIGQSLSSITQSYNQRDLDNLDKQKEHELTLAGDNADAKARIEEQYQKRKTELARKAAIQERAAALFSIAINTAQAVMSVLSTGGGAHYLDFGVSAGILSAFVTAAGIAQAAAVLAKPLPAFWSGTTSAPEGFALVGDRGPELRKKTDGSYQYYDKPTVDYLGAGDVIYTASQTARMVADWQRDESARQALQESLLYNQTADHLQIGRRDEQVIIHQLALNGNPPLSESQLERAFGRALDARPVNETNIDEIGVRRGQRRGRNREEYLEQRHRH
ncbi:hypothetical protein [Spirosoma areae]